MSEKLTKTQQKNLERLGGHNPADDPPSRRQFLTQVGGTAAIVGGAVGAGLWLRDRWGMEGVKPPAGEAYMGIENPKGELGYYMVSDGSAKPVRWRIRPPSFINISALPRMCEGALLSDVIAINASVDIVMGEVDR